MKEWFTFQLTQYFSIVKGIWSYIPMKLRSVQLKRKKKKQGDTVYYIVSYLTLISVYRFYARNSFQEGKCFDKPFFG